MEKKEYKIYITNVCDPISFNPNNEGVKCIGTVYSHDEVYPIIDNYILENNIRTESYWRYLMSDDCTVIDYGSWSNFFAITPAYGLS